MYNGLFMRESYLCENTGGKSKSQTKQTYKFTASKGYAPFERLRPFRERVNGIQVASSTQFTVYLFKRKYIEALKAAHKY